MGEPGNPKQQGKLREDTGKPLQTQTICSLAAGPTYVSGGFASVQLRQLYPDAVGNDPDNSGGGVAGSRWRGLSCTQEGHTAGDKHLHCKTVSSLGSSSRAEVSASNSDLQGLRRVFARIGGPSSGQPWRSEGMWGWMEATWTPVVMHSSPMGSSQHPWTWRGGKARWPLLISRGGHTLLHWTSWTAHASVTFPEPKPHHLVTLTIEAA